VADAYAQDGYVVLAPDVFWRQKPGIELDYDDAGRTQAFGHMNQLDFPRTVEDLKQAVGLLRGLPETRGGVASLGYCMGGLLSYMCAANAGVDAAVCYYGGGIQNNLALAAASACPILIHFAEKTAIFRLRRWPFDQGCLQGKKNAVIETYADADHGFNCWERGAYNQKASAVAHGLSLSFLGKVL
jgi:carboxymethylenebutenolidase